MELERDGDSSGKDRGLTGLEMKGWCVAKRPLGGNWGYLAISSYSTLLESECVEARELSLFPSKEVSYEKNKKRKIKGRM